MSSETIESVAGGTIALAERERAPTVAGERVAEEGVTIDWTIYGTPVFRCEARLRQEKDSVSVYLPALPGVASQGDTENAAIANIHEALAAAIETYLARGDEVPWTRDLEAPAAGERSRWVVVHG